VPNADHLQRYILSMMVYCLEPAVVWTEMDVGVSLTEL
jgi:hypothetical protein